MGARFAKTSRSASRPAATTSRTVRDFLFTTRSGVNRASVNRMKACKLLMINTFRVRQALTAVSSQLRNSSKMASQLSIA